MAFLTRIDMAWSPDTVKAKLSSLSELPESIVGVSQWVIFHRRRADEFCTIWLERMHSTTANKRLNLIYLANEVAQQSKARRKEDFLNAFAPKIAEATAIAYKGATNDIQDKIRRTVDVWAERKIWDPPIQQAIESRINELDKSRVGKKLGGSLFSSSSSAAPTELQPLLPLHAALTKADITSKQPLQIANEEYAKHTNPDKLTPTAPVHAARLSALLKNLSSAEGAVAESIKARTNLVSGLEKILASNRLALESDEKHRLELKTRREAIEAEKRKVEDGIMRGVSTDGGTPSSATANGNGDNRITTSAEPDRPYIEELTPPPMESVTPTGESTDPISVAAPTVPENENNMAGSTPAFAEPTTAIPSLFPIHSNPPTTPSTNPPTAAPAKKRKLDIEFEGFGAGEDAMAGLDDDVAELLRAESGGR